VRDLYPDLGGGLLMMDSNLRRGKQGRTTEDAEASDTATRKLRAMFERLGIEPLAGRPGQRGAVMTSRSPNGCAHTDPSRPLLGLSEIDYIAGPKAWGPSRFTVHEAQPWEDVPVGVTHRMIYVTVNLPAKAGWAGPPARPAQAPRPRQLKVPTYDSIVLWDSAAKVMERMFATAEYSPLLLPGAANGDGTEREAKLRRLISSVAEAVDPEGAKRRDDAVAGRRGPAPAKARRFKGYNLPRHLVAAFARAREMRKQATRRLQVFRLAQAPAAVQAEVADLRAKAARISKAAAAEANATVESRFQEFIKRAEHLRVHDAQGLYELMRTLSPEDGVDAEDAGDANKVAPELVGTFQAFYKAQYTAAGAAVPGPAEGHWPIPAGPVRAWVAITAAECYHRFEASAPSVAIPACVGGGPQCVICAERRQQRAALLAQGWDTDRADAVEIDASPCLSTTSAGGPDGVNPKLLRWPRHQERSRRVPLRMQLMRALANMYNQWIAEGRVPDAVAKCRTVLIRKVDKAGVKLPADNPSSYRGITMSGVFAKGLSIVLAHRLTHWAVANKQISPEQIGFMPLQGAEDHVVTILDTVRHYWARKPGKQVCAVFIDFKKAYDRVRPDALWHVLRRMNVAPELVDFLASWSDQRTTTLCLNGEDSEPWRMTMGVAQGDPLSPLLFNFYLESLIRSIKADPAFHGVSVETPATGELPARQFAFKLLVYADDIVLLCEGPAQAQHAAAAVQRWAQSWGMELGVGEGKTEAMMFARPGSAAGAPLAPLTLPGRPETIAWTQEYKYLGFLLRPDLDTSGLLERMADNVDAAWKRYFYGNRAMRHVSPVLALQVYRACVLGAANYLLGIIEPTAAICGHMDAHSLAVTRQVLHAFKRTPNSLLWAEGHLPKATTLMLRERARLYLKMQHTPARDSPLRRVMEVIKQDVEQRPDARVRPHASTPWVLRTQRILAAKQQQLGVALGQPTAAWDCGRVAAVYGRAVGVLEWQEGTARHLTHTAVGMVPQPVAFSPGSEASKEEAAAFMALGYNVTAASLGQIKGRTPLSARGPGCSGALLTSTSRRLTSRAMGLLMGVRTGSEGWRRVGTDGFDAAEQAAHAADPSCRTCGTGRPEGPFHACCECPHAATAAVRAQAQASLPSMIYHLVRLGYQSIEPRDGTEDFSEEPAEAARQLAEQQDWDTAEGRFLFFRLLAVAPWPAAVPHSEPGPLTAALGRMFDVAVAKPHRIRPLANMWTAWSSKWLHHVHAAYFDAQAGPPAVP
jgi:hypothetical protein